MERINLTDQLDFSRLVYGMWRVKDDDHTPAYLSKKIRACLEQGITTIDQADIYGGYSAEKILGGALQFDSSLRGQIEIVTKCDIVAPIGKYDDRRVKHYDTSRAHIQASVESSLKDMAIDHIDLLLIHRPDPFMDHHETGGVLDDLVKSGKVRAVGVSNFKPHDMELLGSAMSSPLVTNQIELSVTSNQAFTNGDIAYLQKHGISAMAWSPLGGGSLFQDKQKPLYKTLEALAQTNSVDVGAIAVAWLLAHPAKILPVMGTNNIDRIKSLSDATKVEIDRQTWFEIYEKANGVAVP